MTDRDRRVWLRYVWNLLRLRFFSGWEELGAAERWNSGLRILAVLCLAAVVLAVAATLALALLA